MWTRFMDMHSGGGCKEPPYEYIYIEAPEEEARVIFYNRFGHNPDRVTCTCCGEDYSTGESETLAQSSAYDRRCEYVYRDKNGKIIKNPKYDYSRRDYGEGVTHGYEETNGSQSVEDYMKSKYVLVISASEIKPEERKGEVPEQGYVWKD